MVQKLTCLFAYNCGIKTMKINHTATWMLVTIVLIISCKKGNYERDFMPKPIPSDTCSVNITFSKHVSAIIGSKCAVSGCHNSTGLNPAFLNYQDISSYASRIKTRINDAGNPMPPVGATPLTSCEVAKLSSWISAGAQNN